MHQPQRRDRRLILAAGFLRSVGISLVGVLLGIHLARIGFSPARVGLVTGAGLCGAALGTLAVTRWGDRFGRRRSLVAAALLGAAGAAVLASGTTLPVVALAAFAGMINAMGRDRGACAVIEQAALPATVPDRGRTLAFAWYGALQSAGHALGSLMAGIPSLLARDLPIRETAANRIGLSSLPVLLLATILCYLALSRQIEPPGAGGAGARVPPATRAILYRLSGLFGLDGLGGGFLLTSLLSYFFFERFGASGAAVAALFGAARVLNLLSNFAAAWLARRFGLVNTMVFTHIPSSLFLAGVAFVPSFGWAALLFLLREAVSQMDVPTRQSYLMAMVEPEARTLASGVTNIVRLCGWAAGSVAAGALMQHLSLATPLLVGAGLKIGYDLLLYRDFRNLRPPEERA